MSKNCNKIIQTNPTTSCSPPRTYVPEEYCEDYVDVEVSRRFIFVNTQGPFYGSPTSVTFFNDVTSTGNVVLSAIEGLVGSVQQDITIAPGNSATISYIKMGSASILPAVGATINGRACVKTFKRVNL